jgi:NADH-quinone oxidoreductase subunit J
MLSLHFFLLLVFCFCGFFVFLSANPMHSVLFLILTFCCAACILFLFSVDFLGLVFIMIYVGAVAILFLFVVMMLDVKTSLLDPTAHTPIILSLGAFFLVQVFFFISQSFGFGEVKQFHFEKSIDALHNIDSLGQLLYNYFLPCFLIAGIVLLVALVGAIILTLNFNSSRKNQLISRQLSRSIKCVHSFDM